MLSLGLTVRSHPLGAFAAVVAFGFVLGIVGHVVRSRTIVVTALLVIGMGLAGVFLTEAPS